MKTATKTANDCPLIRGKAFEEEREICLNCPLRQCFYEIYHRGRKLTHAERGRLGGYVTSAKYGSDAMREWGRKGGRSRLPTLEEIRQQQLLEAQNNKKEVMDTPGISSNNLKELRRLYKLRHRSNGHKQKMVGIAFPH